MTIDNEEDVHRACRLLRTQAADEHDVHGLCSKIQSAMQNSSPCLMDDIKDAMMIETSGAARLRAAFSLLCSDQAFLRRLQGSLCSFIFPQAWPSSFASFTSSFSVPLQCSGPVETGMFLPAGKILVVQCTDPGARLQVVVSRADLDDHMFVLNKRYTLLYSPVGGRLVVHADRGSGAFELLFYGGVHRQVLYVHGVSVIDCWRHTLARCSPNICIVTKDVTICAPSEQVLGLGYAGVHRLATVWDAVYTKIRAVAPIDSRLEVVVSGDHNVRRGIAVFTEKWALNDADVLNMGFWQCLVPEKAALACLHACIQTCEMSWEQACDALGLSPSSQGLYLSTIGQDCVVPLSCVKQPQRCPQVCNPSLVPWKALAFGENTVALVFDTTACKVSSILLSHVPFTIMQGGTQLGIKNMSVRDYEIELTFELHAFEHVLITLHSPDMLEYGSLGNRFIFREATVSCMIETSAIIQQVPHEVTQEYCLTEHVMYTHHIGLTNGIFGGSGYMLLDRDVVRLLSAGFELRFCTMLRHGHMGILSIGQGRRNELLLSSIGEGSECTLTLCLYDSAQQANRLRLTVAMGTWLNISMCVGSHSIKLSVDESSVASDCIGFTPELKFMVGSQNMGHSPIRMSHIFMTSANAD